MDEEEKRKVLAMLRELDLEVYSSGGRAPGIRSDLEGCRALWVAVIGRCVRDICYPGNAARMREARQWLYSEDLVTPGGKGVTFRWVCEALGLDREWLLRRVEELRRRVAGQARKRAYAWRYRRASTTS